MYGQVFVGLSMFKCVFKVLKCLSILFLKTSQERNSRESEE